jgi:hypothetical protein
MGWMTEVAGLDSWYRQEIFFFSIMLGLALGPTQPSVQCVLEVGFPMGKAARE